MSLAIAGEEKPNAERDSIEQLGNFSFRVPVKAAAYHPGFAFPVAPGGPSRSFT